MVQQTVSANNTSNEQVMASTFLNEIHFYKTLWPVYDNFQKGFAGIVPFDKFPKFYGSRLTPGKEKLIMENLKYSGFEMIHRDGTFQDTYLKLLLNSYGQFHGISAFRELHTEKSKKLTNEWTNSSELVLKMDVISMYIRYCLKKESMKTQYNWLLISCSIMEGILVLIMEIAGAITSF